MVFFVFFICVADTYVKYNGAHDFDSLQAYVYSQVLIWATFTTTPTTPTPTTTILLLLLLLQLLLLLLLLQLLLLRLLLLLLNDYYY